MKQQTEFTTAVKAKTKKNRDIAWFTVRICWHRWAERRLSNPQTIRGDFRVDEQTSENVLEQLQDLLNYLEDNLGMIQQAILYDNRRPYPHCEILKFQGNRVRLNKLPEGIQNYAQHLLSLIEKQPAA